MTTSSNKTFTEFLNNADFAEMAKEHKKQLLLEAKQKRDQKEQKEADEKEKARIAALPKITEDDIKNAEAAGYEKGKVAGKEAASEELKKEFEDRLSAMRNKIEDIPNIIKEQIAHLQISSLNLTRDILKATIAHSSKHYSEEVLAFMIAQTLERCQKEAKLFISLSPSDRFYLEAQGKDILKDLDVEFIEDDTLSSGDCIVGWDNSGADARLSEITQEIDIAIDAAARSIKPEDIEFEFIAKAATVIEETHTETVMNSEELTKNTEDTTTETETSDNVAIEPVEATTEKDVEKPQKDIESSEDVTIDKKNVVEPES